MKVTYDYLIQAEMLLLEEFISEPYWQKLITVNSKNTALKIAKEIDNMIQKRGIRIHSVPENAFLQGVRVKEEISEQLGCDHEITFVPFEVEHPLKLNLDNNYNKEKGEGRWKNKF